MKRWDQMYPLLKDRIDELERQIEIVRDCIAENQPPTPRKRGRPRKSATSVRQSLANESGGTEALSESKQDSLGSAPESQSQTEI